MTTFFTSDLHFGHVRILEYEADSRPFASTLEMDEALIDNWNSVVTPSDHTYIVGDFMMGDRSRAAALRARLNGKITLVEGNHDVDKRGNCHKTLLDAGFDNILKWSYMRLDGKYLFVAHIPRMDFTQQDENDYHICGHVHGSWTRAGPIINCGVDVCGLKPVTLDFLLAQPEVHGKSHRGY